MKYSAQEQEDYYGYIYVTLDQKHNKVYVGQKKGKIEKSKNYFGSGTIITNIIKDRGIYFLKKFVLGVCYSKEELTFWETECKHFFKALDRKYGYNKIEKDTGGDTWMYLTEEERQIRSLKFSISFTGRLKGRTSPMKGKKSSKEANLKRSKSLTGIKHSEERKRNNSDGHKGTKWTEESLKKRKITRQKTYYGKNTPTYKKIDFIFLIQMYFDIVTVKELLIIYNNTHEISISGGIYDRFLKTLFFPKNVLIHSHPKERGIYLKFVKENKHKINWYIENYERLEEEYFLKLKEKRIKEN